MKENEENNVQKPKKKFITKTVLFFALGVVLACGIVFLLCYDFAYNDNSGAGWLPPSFGVVINYFWIVVFSCIVAVALKIIYVSHEKQVSIIALLLAAVLLPIICYQFNYHTLKKGGVLYPLMDEGGIFYFIAIDDYDFDGMNDELHEYLYEERQYSSRAGGHYDDTIIDYIDTDAIGTGTALNCCYSSYYWEEQLIKLHIDKHDVKYKKIIVTVAFQDASTTKNTIFYIDGVEITPKKLDSKTVRFVFDAKTCAEFQETWGERYNEWGERSDYVPINYVVENNK